MLCTINYLFFLFHIAGSILYLLPTYSYSRFESMSYCQQSFIWQSLWKTEFIELLSRFCFIVQVSNEEAKKIEISKLQKMLEAQNLELDATKLATINECNKNAVLQNQLELSVKEKSALKTDLVAVDELRKENALLKVLN